MGRQRQGSGARSQRAPPCPKERKTGVNESPQRTRTHGVHDRGKQNTDLRFRWSASCQPGEGLVARGGVEPPTFRFSAGSCGDHSPFPRSISDLVYKGIRFVLRSARSASIGDHLDVLVEDVKFG